MRVYRVITGVKGTRTYRQNPLLTGENDIFMSTAGHGVQGQVPPTRAKPHKSLVGTPM